MRRLLPEPSAVQASPSSVQVRRSRCTVEMGTEPVIIGRANDCQIQTQDGLVSRRHAKVIFDGRYYFVEDNGSANGVYVGAERVQRHQLRGGDVFRCGHLEVRFDVEDL